VRILYVTNSRHGRKAWFDPSARHRCYHFADALASSGYRARVVHVDDVDRHMVAQCEHIIFHRPKISPGFTRAMSVCSASAAVLHADYDDLIFNHRLAASSPLYLNGVRPLDKVCDYFSASQEASGLFSNVIVSTRYLAEQFRLVWPNVSPTVLANSLPRLFRSPRVNEHHPDQFTVGYFPGSNSHEHDIKMIIDALSSFCMDSKKHRLVIVGRIRQQELSKLSGYVKYIPFVDYNMYLKHLASVNVSIAPLVDNVFNRSKSAVKLIESVAVGTPILVSANDDMTDHNNILSTIVDSPEGWRDALARSGDVSAPDRRMHGYRLAQQFSVASRLPVLQEHLQCAA